MSDEAEHTEDTATEHHAAARVGSDIKFSRVWLVPLVALVIGLWMIYAHWAGQGQCA